MGARRWRRALRWLRPLLVMTSLVLSGLPKILQVAAQASLASAPRTDQQPGSSASAGGSGAADVAVLAVAATGQGAANLKQAGTAENRWAESSLSEVVHECDETKGEPQDPTHPRAVHALPSGDGDATPIELGKSVQLDKLGPIIVNSDGTTRRIKNWVNMTKLEQAWALKRINERNKQRVENLNQQADIGHPAENSAQASKLDPLVTEAVLAGDPNN